jgi:hypothetical protein
MKTGCLLVLSLIGLVIFLALIGSHGEDSAVAWRERTVVHGMIVDQDYPCDTISTLRRSPNPRRGLDIFNLGLVGYDWHVVCDHGKGYHVRGTEAYYRETRDAVWWQVTPESPHP